MEQARPGRIRFWGDAYASWDELVPNLEEVRDVGKRQISRGWAKVYVFERPFKRVKRYRRAQRRARSADRAVWGKCGGHFHLPD
jgi:endonuclease YncB( thermonuclease family)